MSQITTGMSISQIAKIIFFISFGINHFLGSGLLGIVAAVAAIVAGVAMLVKE